MHSSRKHLHCIKIQGAREHNLQNISLEIPRDKLVVITGVSGSGKSSLAFDTIYAEGQRRYVESLSAYARQFLGVMEKPDVDLIEGLSPAVSIEQKTSHKNPRSTVGTVTEIYDYLRLLFARAGKPHCYQCGKLVQAAGTDQIIEKAISLGKGTRIQIGAPLVVKKKGTHKDILEKIRKEGFVRMRVNGKIIDTEQSIALEKNKQHTIELIVDRILIKQGIRSRLADSIEIALKYGKGSLFLLEDTKEHYFSSNLFCIGCGISIPELSPRAFSFNSPLGACNQCEGLGVLQTFDENLLLPDKNKSLMEGVISIWESHSYWYIETLQGLSNDFGLNPNLPWKKLSSLHQKLVLYGSDSISQNQQYYEGVIPTLMRRYRETKSDDARSRMEQFMHEKTCSSCTGDRLRPESLSVLYHGQNITNLTRKNIVSLQEWFSSLKLSKLETKIVYQVLREIRSRLSFLNDVGVGYLNLSRSAGSLSGGEAQRIRLATQIGSSLMGVLYVLDEPSIGLHQRDNKRLLDSLKKMRDLGNTVIVVEHDEDTICSADHVIDIGPGAGVHGGNITAEGTPAELKKISGSITGEYLSGKRFIPVPCQRRKGNEKKITVIGASQNNLKKIDVEFPCGKLICVTGVSGSGKSTLVNDILYKGLVAKTEGSRIRSGRHRSIQGRNLLDRFILINQEPIGRTPRSNPATYTGLFTPVRELFAGLPEARVRGYLPGRFSFNVKGGRCENCEGAGTIKIEMHFLPDVYITCDSCKGRRFNQETLEVKYKNQNIFDVLSMTVEKALLFFQNIHVIQRRLQTLSDVGLEYIHLGQAATTLSGGEAQRIKLATELSKNSTAQTLYILDEPTTGLHFEDISRLLRVLHNLVDRGSSMIVIEHNLDVIKTADHIIDLGPEGGEGGGRIIAEGTPEEVSQTKGSSTGFFLKKTLSISANLQKSKAVARKDSPCNKTNRPRLNQSQVRTSVDFTSSPSVQ